MVAGEVSAVILVRDCLFPYCSNFADDDYLTCPVDPRTDKYLNSAGVIRSLLFSGRLLLKLCHVLFRNTLF